MPPHRTQTGRRSQLDPAAVRPRVPSTELATQAERPPQWRRRRQQQWPVASLPLLLLLLLGGGAAAAMVGGANGGGVGVQRSRLRGSDPGVAASAASAPAAAAAWISRCVQTVVADARRNGDGSNDEERLVASALGLCTRLAAGDEDGAGGLPPPAAARRGLQEAGPEAEAPKAEAEREFADFKK